MAATGWFPDWLIAHTELHPRPSYDDWPDPSSEFWREHERAMARHRIDAELATAASRRMVGRMPGRLDAHLTAFLSAVQREREAAILAVRPATIPIDAAREAAARAGWDSLSERERDDWRHKVRARFPELAYRPSFVEAVAIGWHADPAVLPDRPADAPAPRSRQQRPWSTGRVEPNVSRLPDDPEPAPF